MNFEKRQILCVHVPYFQRLGTEASNYRITGIIRKRKCSRIGNFFLIHEKTFANGDNPSWIYSFLPISPLATPIFQRRLPLQKPYKSVCTNAVAIVDTIISQSCHSSYTARAVEYSARAYYDCSLKTLNLHPSDLHWDTYGSQVGFSAITALSLDLHLWAGINKTKTWKFSKKMFANTLRFTKFANIFFSELFPLYGNLAAIL